MKKPLIFDIKRTSTTDGPGIRTVFFFKGCNLNCYWCHNPEGKKATPQVAYFSKNCLSCGACKVVCDKAENGCVACAKCVEVCPASARKLYGKPYEIKELLFIVEKDINYFNASGGGVTFSGGECMLYVDFLTELAIACKNIGVSVAIDTAGNVPYEYFEKVLPYTDLFLYDLKCIDNDLHKKGTGVDNRLILQNLERLIKQKKNIIIRVPVIPGFNQGSEVDSVLKYCAERKLKVELLPYHEFGEDKKRALLG